MSEQSVIRLTPVRDLFAANNGTVDFDNYDITSLAKNLRNHPALCSVCLNLHNVPASIRLGSRGGLWHSDDSAIDRANDKPWEVAYEFRADFVDISAASMGEPSCQSCLLLREAITRFRRRIVGPLEKPSLPLEVWVVFRHDVVLRVDLFRIKGLKENSIQATDDEDLLLTSLNLLGGLDPWNEKLAGGGLGSWNPGGYEYRDGPSELIDQLEIYTLPCEPNPSLVTLEYLGMMSSVKLIGTTGAPCPGPLIGSSMAAHFPAIEKPCQKGGNARHVLPDPSSDDCFELVKQWVASCRMEHPDCIEAESKIPHRLPKRVVDVGPADNSKIRLVEHEAELGRSFDVETEYVALSHCWGPKWTWPIRCVRATLSQFKDNIPFELLSNTFKDAIIITRRLGIKYIWIDSLCIIQDDSRDWEVQAAQMASIYDGAYLTISATGSESGRDGCLGTRNLGHEVLTCQSPEGRLCEVYTRRAIDHSIFGVNETDMISGGNNVPLDWFWDYPLQTRAWCFQERLLSTRILHYTKSEMVFDCLSAMQCECGALEGHEGDPLLFPRRIIKLGPESIRTEPLRVRIKGHVRQKNWFEDNSAGYYELQKLQRWYGVPEFNLYHQLWRELIVQFSQKQITFQSDALPAVAGLAQKWPKDVTGRYLAGLWEKQLLSGMRWQIDKIKKGTDGVAEVAEATRRFQRTKPNEEYVAPSWSWASAKGPVTWGFGNLDHLEYFVQVDHERSRCHTSGPDEFGRVDSGYIFLTGRIMPISFTLPGDPYEPRIDAKHDAHASWWRLGRADDERRLPSLLGEKLICLRFSSPTSPSEVGAQGVDCGLVLGPPNPRNLVRQPDEVRRYPNVYERVGILMGYRTIEWHHDEESEEMSMYII